MKRPNKDQSRISSPVKPYNQIYNLNLDKGMNNHNEKNFGDKIHRIELLESNVNRVYNQHQTLKHLLAESEVFKKISECVYAIQQLHKRSIQLQQSLDELKVKKQIKENGIKKEDEGKFKELNFELYNIKQQIKKIRTSQAKVQRENQDEKKSIIREGKTIYDRELLEMGENVTKYLANLQKRFSFSHSDKVISTAKTKLKYNYQNSCSKIEADLGMLLCELQFLESQHYQEKVKRKIEAKPIKEEEQMGKFERELLVDQLTSFLKENQNRLIYEYQLLLHKIVSLEKCVKNRQGRERQKSSMSLDYGNEFQRLNGRFAGLQHEYLGLLKRKKIEKDRIKVLDEKLSAISPEVLPEFIKFERENEEVRTKLRDCRLELKGLGQKIKHNFLYF